MFLSGVCCPFLFTGFTFGVSLSTICTFLINRSDLAGVIYAHTTVASLDDGLDKVDLTLELQTIVADLRRLLQDMRLRDRQCIDREQVRLVLE